MAVLAVILLSACSKVRSRANEVDGFHPNQHVEHGPCNVTEDLVSQLNPYSWNEASNMIYLSQPLGVGFSYGSKVAENPAQLIEVGLTRY